MAYYGGTVYYRGHFEDIKEITQLHEYLLIKFKNGRIISYDLGVPKILFEEDKNGKSK